MSSFRGYGLEISIKALHRYHHMTLQCFLTDNVSGDIIFLMIRPWQNDELCVIDTILIFTQRCVEIIYQTFILKALF